MPDKMKPAWEILHEIPGEIRASALSLERRMTELGHQRWELYGVCSRNLLWDAQAALKECRERIRVLEQWEDRARKAERELDKFLHAGSGSDL